ncbi:MAG: response regulator transcription factor [Chloroflexi bacterium]|nr:response regulator transcription factor [Chloroflexota bacterium]
MDEVRVLVAAADPLARAGLATMLAGQLGCSIVGQVGVDSDLREVVEVYRPDVVILDLHSPTALERWANFRNAGAPVVALLPDDGDAAQAWSTGVRGLILRDATPEHIVAALNAAVEGLATFDPALVAALLPSRIQPPAPPAEQLTPREIQVLQLLAEGAPNKEIARRLGISEHTVKFHVNAILGKLNVQSRTEAVVRATRLGLILL